MSCRVFGASCVAQGHVVSPRPPKQHDLTQADVGEFCLPACSKHHSCYLCRHCYKKCGLFCQLQMFIAWRLRAMAPHTQRSAGVRVDVSDDMCVFVLLGGSCKLSGQTFSLCVSHVTHTCKSVRRYSITPLCPL